MKRERVLLWGPFLVYCALWAFLFAGLARYHFPLVPIFAVLAGIGLSSFLQALPFARKPSGAAGRPTPDSRL